MIFMIFGIDFLINRIYSLKETSRNPNSRKDNPPYCYRLIQIVTMHTNVTMHINELINGNRSELFDRLEEKCGY